MGNFSDYATTADLIAAWEGPAENADLVSKAMRNAMERARKDDQRQVIETDHYANNEDFGQF